MPGILGNRPLPQRSILGGYAPIRQIAAPMGPQPMPPQASPFAMGGGPIDPRDAPGSGLSIWRELVRGLSSKGLAALSPDIAGRIFSPENRALLAPEYQRQRQGK